MREIKFRMWCKKERKMYKVKDGADIVFDSEGYVDNISIKNKVLTKNDFILMQYTGLKDKNGKEIYEGDIVKIMKKMPSILILKPYIKGIKGVIEFDVNRLIFGITYKDDRWERWEPLICCGEEILEIEIIGNIYDNPELLKELSNEVAIFSL